MYKTQASFPQYHTPISQNLNHLSYFFHQASLFLQKPPRKSVSTTNRRAQEIAVIPVRYCCGTAAVTAPGSLGEGAEGGSSLSRGAMCHGGSDEERHVVGDGIWARAQDLIRSASSIDCNHGASLRDACCALDTGYQWTASLDVIMTSPLYLLAIVHLTPSADDTYGDDWQRGRTRYLTVLGGKTVIDASTFGADQRHLFSCSMDESLMSTTWT
ncbi:hypothetical protein KM043_008340 [Ampulex compressa]|nr:hypothetical protein KM043_008340 [Ampulex compressa]